MAAHDEFIEGDGDTDPLDEQALYDEAEGKKQAARNAIEETKVMLQAKGESYRRLLGGTPMEGDREKVMLDLAKFCRAYESTFDANQRIHAVLEGRREVWLRIADFLNLDRDALFVKYTNMKG